MAKATSNIAQGLFTGDQISAYKDVGSFDTPVVATTPSKEHQERGTGDRQVVAVVMGNDQPQKVVGERKKPAEATVGANKPSENWGTYQTHQGNHSGQKTRRMCVAMPDDAYRFIRREAIKRGMTYGEYIYVLAQAAAQGEVVI